MKSTVSTRAELRMGPRAGARAGTPVRITRSTPTKSAAPHWEPDSALIDALYERASKLERLWPLASVSLAPGRMVDAVLRHVLRLLASGQITPSEANNHRHLVRMLSWIWTRNARRDYARSRSGQTQPLTDGFCDPSDCFGAVEDRQLLGTVWSHLIAAGNRGDQALAFLLTAQGLESGEVGKVLSRTFRRPVTASTVRQWRRRAFPQMRAQLRTSSALFSVEVQ